MLLYSFAVLSKIGCCGKPVRVCEGVRERVAACDVDPLAEGVPDSDAVPLVVSLGDSDAL